VAGKITLRDPRIADVYTLAMNMRPLDRAEVTAASGDVFEALLQAFEKSDLMVSLELDGELACTFGVVPADLLRTTGVIWMLGTPLMNQLARPLIEIGRRYVAEAAMKYRRLCNHVDARNAPSIRLLDKLGFELSAPQPFGVAGLPFHYFERWS
jgi:RimJ/RimL family protein N-acetyltransferase